MRRSVLESAGLEDWAGPYPDQYASHQNEKERAQSLVNEVHGVAAQIRQAEQDEHELHFHPLDASGHSTKGLNTALPHQRSMVDRVVDFFGFRPYLEQRKREDGVHEQRWAKDEDRVDRFDYLRDEAGKRKPVVYEETTEGEQRQHGEHHVSTLKAELQHLKEKFQHFTQQAKEAIKSRLAPPFHEEQETKGGESAATEGGEAQTEARHASGGGGGNESLGAPLLLPRPQHPLLDPLHDILRNVDSMTTTPLLPAPPRPAGWWQRLMQSVFPSHLEEQATGLYKQAREEARQEAMSLREVMRGEYEDIKRQLRELKKDVVEGKGQEPLELYEQYNPEPVHAQDTPKGTA